MLEKISRPTPPEWPTSLREMGEEVTTTGLSLRVPLGLEHKIRIFGVLDEQACESAATNLRRTDSPAERSIVIGETPPTWGSGGAAFFIDQAGSGMRYSVSKAALKS